MKKIWRIYAWAWAVVVALILVTAVVMAMVPSHHDLARDPYTIERVVEVDLPEIVQVESEDNLDRGTSRWDVYTHQGQFGEPISKESIDKLDRLCQTDSEHWRRDEEKGYYQYTDEGGVDDLYEVSCTLYADHFVVGYTVDESEGLFLFIPFVLAFYVLINVGIVLAVISLIRKIKNRKNCQ